MNRIILINYPDVLYIYIYIYIYIYQKLFQINHMFKSANLFKGFWLDIIVMQRKIC